MSSTPHIYLSPSVQGNRHYVSGIESEEYYMNKIADIMIPQLQSCGISCTRNNPYDTLSRIVSRSNALNCDFHLALHSNSAPKRLSGLLRGPELYYSASCSESKRAAKVFASGLKSIYPDPSLIAAVPNSSLAELRETKAPALLIELGYHDHIRDARWITEHIRDIGEALSSCIRDYLNTQATSFQHVE